MALFHVNYDEFKGLCREASKDESFVYISFDTSKESEIKGCNCKEKSPEKYTVCIYETNQFWKSKNTNWTKTIKKRGWFL